MSSETQAVVSEIPRVEKPPVFSLPPFLHAIAFVLGFSVVFTALGAALGLIGTGSWRDWLEIGAGSVLIVLGFNLSGIFKFGKLTDILYRQRSLDVGVGSKPSYVRSTMVGSAFAIGWTPCVGPILAGILTLTIEGSVTQGAILMFVYSLGLGLPFLAVGAFLGVAKRWLKKINPYMELIELTSGLLLVLIGALIVTDSLQLLNNYFTFIPEVTGSSEVTSLGVGSLVIAFGGGILSFLSPCILPLVPIWLGYMAGTTIEGIPLSSTQPALAGSN
ncbi:MAG: cytochrome c biogenesis protein CcdA [Dehalococcoidia bacterium]